ncbi:hypothetical protein ACJ5H2_05925 [Nocardioides sp. R1-1]|uniref:hypothetical protein n=1 Tax=Nocardioides sp. R1-1 TaxID=3383502 RepID=UPI0038CF42B6
MTIETYQLGPGTLTLGALGSALSVSSQVRSCAVETSENVTTRPAIPVLSGEKIAETSSETFSHVLTGTFLQDLAAGGVVDWSWQHRGTEQPFTFVPATAEGREVSGILKPVPLKVGGDVENEGEGDPPSADFSWRIIGAPTFGAVAP